MEEKNSSLPELLTTRDISEWLKISESRVYTLCSQHQFPFIKVTKRRTRYSARAVIAWLDARSAGEGIND